MIISSNIISSEMSSDAAGCGDRPALGNINNKENIHAND